MHRPPRIRSRSSNSVLASRSSVAPHHHVTARKYRPLQIYGAKEKRHSFLLCLMLISGQRALRLGRIRTTSSAQPWASVSTIRCNSRLPAREPVTRRHASKLLEPSLAEGRRLSRRSWAGTGSRSYSLAAVDAASPSFTGEDTIYALSTAQGRAGIAVIRISGTRCLDVTPALCRSLAPRESQLNPLPGLPESLPVQAPPTAPPCCRPDPRRYARGRWHQRAGLQRHRPLLPRPQDGDW